MVILQDLKWSIGYNLLITDYRGKEIDPDEKDDPEGIEQESPGREPWDRQPVSIHLYRWRRR
jgi:hypothetical protein